VRVVLVDTRNPLNIGAAARAMSNFGFFNLRLVHPWDPSWKEARSAVNAGAVLEAARVFDSLAEAIADCALVVGTTAIGHRQLQHPVRRLEYGSRLLRAHSLQAPVAILFGSEKYGLSNEELSFCQWLMRIPSRPEHGSMNLGQAVAVCLYELIRQRVVAPPVERTAANAAELDRITAALTEVLRESGYMHDESAELKIRRLVRRMDVSAADAEVWLGMLRQIGWKIGRGSA
jgi:TrmH family RNA methyltransferase